MKEIDFLPDWYKADRRRQINVRRQYAALGGIFITMLTWNLATTHSISKATVNLAKAEAKRAEAEDMLVRFAKVRNKVTNLQEKAHFIDKIDSKINIANILAELSFLIGPRIVLNNVEFVAEKFADNQGEKPKRKSAIRAAKRGRGENDKTHLGDVRFKIVISGLAADASDVAAMICKLEESPYFQLVYPSFSRNTKVKVSANSTSSASDVQSPSGQAEGTFNGTEFEISCYLANYKEDIISSSKSILED